jgi:hypothetical protein
VPIKSQDYRVKQDRDGQERKAVVFFGDAQIAVLGDKEKEERGHKAAARVHDLYGDDSSFHIPATDFNEVTQRVKEQGNDAVHEAVPLFAPAALQGDDAHIS